MEGRVSGSSEPARLRLGGSVRVGVVVIKISHAPRGAPFFLLQGGFGASQDFFCDGGSEGLRDP